MPVHSLFMHSNCELKQIKSKEEKNVTQNGMKIKICIENLTTEFAKCNKNANQTRKLLTLAVVSPRKMGWSADWVPLNPSMKISVTIEIDFDQFFWWKILRKKKIAKFTYFFKFSSIIIFSCEIFSIVFILCCKKSFSEKARICVL